MIHPSRNEGSSEIEAAQEHEQDRLYYGAGGAEAHESAGRVLARIGVSTSDAITMFLRQVVMRQGMPFDVAVPNTRTRRAIEELETSAKRGKLKRHVRADAMFADILDRRGNQTKKRA